MATSWKDEIEANVKDDFINKHRLDEKLLTIKPLKLVSNKTLAEGIRDHFMYEEKHVDFVVCSNTGADMTSSDDKKFLGPLAKTLITETKMNVLLTM